VQVLLWDYTHTLPEGVNNQQYFIKDLPAKTKGEAAVRIQGLKKGDYTLKISQVGYKRNDAYTGYIGMGSPAQLTKPQVDSLKAMATGKPSEERQIKVDVDGKFNLNLPLRENDVYLVEIKLAK
jgi:xylan 1,4-beta-xylosidase